MNDLLRDPPLAYRPDLDGLRAVAVLSVMLFHLDVPGFSGGYTGVDVFFVISGYLITRNLVRRWEAGRWSLADFYGRRLRRIFPALFFTLVTSLTLGFLLLSPLHLERLAEATLWTNVLLPNVYFWRQQGYFDALARFKPTLHTWSLGIEEQFYLLWPLALPALRRAPRAVAVGTLVVLAAASVGLGERWLAIDAGAAFYLLPFRCFGLALGAALVFVRRPRAGAAEPLVLAGLGAIAWAVVGFDDKTPYPGLHALVPVLGAALVVHAGEAPMAGRLLRTRILVAIGLVSYSLYLIHWPLLVFYEYWTLRPLGPREHLGVAVVSLGAAAMMYRFVEQPFRAGQRARLGPAGFACACLGLTVPLMFVGAIVWGERGLPWRVSARPEPPIPGAAVYCRPASKHPGCLLGVRKPTPEDVLLIGDSHADALATGLDHLARRHHLKMRRWTLRGCPPLFDVFIHYRQSGPLVDNEPLCAATRAAWKAYVRERRPKIVVLAAHWAAYTETAGDYGIGMLADKLVLDPADAVATKDASRRIFPRALADTVETIAAAGSKVVIFSTPPALGVSLAACRDVPTYLIGAVQKAERCKVVTYEQAMDRVAFTDGVIAGLASPDVLAILTKRAFCDAATRSCEFFAKGRALFRDSHHLSPAGSMRLARYAAADFADMVRRAGLERRAR
jgi:peptidoglycan/LPS O-acetylase OafA/YrhL